MNRLYCVIIFLLFLLTLGFISAADNGSLDNSTLENIDSDVVEYNECSNMRDIEEKHVSLQSGEGSILESQENDVLEDVNYRDYYYNTSRTISPSVMANANFHLGQGNYSVSPSYMGYTNFSFYGQGADKTILTGYSRPLQLMGFCSFANLTITNNVIFADWGRFNFTNVVFKNCTGEKGGTTGGGALNIASLRAHVCINNCTFIDNSVDGFGGAIYMHYGGLEIYNTRFINNRATQSGGAIYKYNSILDMQNCTFINNTALRAGGAVFADTMTYLIANQTEFINNTCVNDSGGAIHADSAYFRFTDVDIINSSARFGGAICAIDSYGYIKNCLMENNVAKYDGGAFYLSQRSFFSSQILNVFNTTFKENLANDGGAIFADTQKYLNLTSNKFIQNTARNNGGAVYLYFFDVDVSDNLYLNNAAENSKDVCKSYYVNMNIGNGNYMLIKLNDTFNGIIPSRYDGRELGLVSSVDDQMDSYSCWAFATLATLESCILKSTGIEFDFSENNLKNLIKKYSTYGVNSHPRSGDAFEAAFAYLTSWLGPVNESDDLFSTYGVLSPILESIMHVQNILYIQRSDKLDLNPIKEAILRYGAVGTTVYWKDKYLNGSSYYCNVSERNHAITVVGWDDNYSRYNFKNTPEGDGAWLVKNSWGDSNYVGMNGFYYISYYDDSFSRSSQQAETFTFILNDTVRYDRNYQYDIQGNTNWQLYSDKVWIKNEFTSVDDEYLAAASTYFMAPSNFELSVYVNGELKSRKSGKTNAGYYTFNLDNIVPLKKGDKFEIVFKVSLLSDGTLWVPVCNNNDVSKNFFNLTSSFISTDGLKWSKQYYSSVCIKAFTRLNKLNTSIDLTVDYTKYYPVNITAKVFDEMGNPIKTGQVIFNLAGKEYRVNIFNGIAKITHNFEEGSNKISATFNDDAYGSSFASKTISVSKIKVNFNITSSIYQNTAEINISASRNINEYMLVEINGETQIIKLSKGKYSLKLNNLKNGNYNLKISFNDSAKYSGSVSGNFNIHVKKTSLVADDFVTYEYSKEKLKIQLFDEDNNPISNKKLILTIGQKNYSATIGENGTALKNINLASGNYNLIITFQGDKNYFKSQTNISLVVKEKITVSAEFNQTVNNISVNISLSKNITTDMILSINGIDNVVKAINGKASYNFNDLDYGNYTIKISLDDKYHYNNIAKNFTVTVRKTFIKSEDSIVIIGNPNIISILLVDGKNNPIPDKVVKFNYEGGFLEEVTDEFGVAKVNITYNDIGDYMVSINFEGDETYLSSSCLVSAKVRKALYSTISIEKSFNDINLKVMLSENINAMLNVYINEDAYDLRIQNGKGVLKLNNLKIAHYNVKLGLTDKIYKLEGISGDINFDITKNDLKIQNPKSEIKLTLKKVKVKRSAKKLVLKATLKINKKAVKGKVIKFKFNKKTFKAKTNKKGLAKVTIKKKFLKKLKVGKKVKIQAKYGNTVAKLTVKVKK